MERFLNQVTINCPQKLIIVLRTCLLLNLITDAISTTVSVIVVEMVIVYYILFVS